MKNDQQILCAVALSDARRIRSLLIALLDEFSDLIGQREQFAKFNVEGILRPLDIHETDLF
jgi:hypothetical protein